MTPRRNPVFLDTAYLNALVNTRDEWHDAARRWEHVLAATRQALVTSEFVLVEIADALAAIRFRPQATRVIRALRGSPLVDIVPASSRLFVTGLDLYGRRSDKGWGLTVHFLCDHGREGLVARAHGRRPFSQAGFRALLLEGPPEGLQP